MISTAPWVCVGQVIWGSATHSALKIFMASCLRHLHLCRCSTLSTFFSTAPRFKAMSVETIIDSRSRFSLRTASLWYSTTSRLRSAAHKIVGTCICSKICLPRHWHTKLMRFHPLPRASTAIMTTQRVTLPGGSRALTVARAYTTSLGIEAVEETGMFHTYIPALTAQPTSHCRCFVGEWVHNEFCSRDRWPTCQYHDPLPVLESYTAALLTGAVMDSAKKEEL